MNHSTCLRAQAWTRHNKKIWCQARPTCLQQMIHLVAAVRKRIGRCDHNPQGHPFDHTRQEFVLRLVCIEYAHHDQYYRHIYITSQMLENVGQIDHTLLTRRFHTDISSPTQQ